MLKFSQPSVEELFPRQRLLDTLGNTCQLGLSVWVGAPPAGFRALQVAGRLEFLS